MREHLPGAISRQQASVRGPDGEYLQLDIAVTKCTCGRVHAAAADVGVGFDAAMGSAEFQLGVLYSQLNGWHQRVDDAMEVPSDA